MNKKYYREIEDMTAEQYHQSQKPKKPRVTVAEQVKLDKKAKGNARINALRDAL